MISRPDPSKTAVLASVALFAIACATPALRFHHSGGRIEENLGLHVLAIGWTGIFAGIFAWCANPLWVLGVIAGFLGAKRLPVIILGVLALAIAATTFPIVGQELPGDEGNVTRMTVVRLLPGCYIWMASLALLPVAAMLPRGPKQLPPPFPQTPPVLPRG